MSAVLDTAIGRMFPPAFQSAHPDEIALRKAALGRVDAGSFRRACLALASMDSTSELSKITNPTLVMCGELDLTTPPALVISLAQGISGSTYQSIADCGHCPMVEQPVLLAAYIEDFLHTRITS